MIDDIDRKILTILQEHARISNAEIARRVEMAPSAVYERIRKLEERGVILGYGARIDPTAVEMGLLAYILVRTDERPGAADTTHHLARVDEVQEVHHVAGEDCFLVKVRCENTEALGRLLRERFGSIDTVTSTRTTIVLETVKDTRALPLGVGDEALDGSDDGAEEATDD